MEKEDLPYSHNATRYLLLGGASFMLGLFMIWAWAFGTNVSKEPAIFLLVVTLISNGVGLDKSLQIARDPETMGKRVALIIGNVLLLLLAVAVLILIFSLIAASKERWSFG